MSPDSLQDVLTVLKKGKKITDPAIHVFAITVTPAMAKELIRANENIRALKKVLVSRYGDDMRLGLWSFTGAAIIFDWNGKLRDGQHRLESCIATGESFDTLVVVGVDPVSSLNLDTGAKRGLGDFLKNEGFKDANNLAASMRLAYQLIELKVVRQQTFSNEVVMHWFRDGGHEGLVADLERVTIWEKDLRALGTGLTRNYLASIRHAASYVKGVDIEDVDAFFSRIASSEVIGDRRTPEYHLRGILQRAVEAQASNDKRKRKDRIQVPVRMAVTINALNAFIAGREVTNAAALAWNPGGKNPQPFPPISPGAMAEIVQELEAEDAEA